MTAKILAIKLLETDADPDDPRTFLKHYQSSPQLFDEYGWFRGEIPEECVSDCSHSGDCGSDVEYWVRKLQFTVPRELAIRHLRDYGAWTKEELAGESDDTLAERVLWLACCDIKENGEWFGLVH